MLAVPLLYLKDKQIFEKAAGTMRLLGNAAEVARHLSKKHELLHILDLDLKNGNKTNFDIYDKLTYFTHIQVECEEAKEVERLLALKARVVVQLPTKLPLEKYNKKLLVGIISKNEDATAVNDVLILKPTAENIDTYKKQGKRIMVYANSWDGKTGKKSIWAVIT